MKIGVSSYSFSKYISQGKLDWISVIKKAADMGFDGMEYIGLPGETQADRIALAEKIKAEAAACGIELSAYAVGGSLLCDTCEAQQKEVDKLKEEIDIAEVLGVKLFRYDVIYKLPGGMSFEAVLRKVAPAMKQLAEYGREKGILTMIENHGQAFQDYDRIEKIYDAVDHENFRLLLDIGNFMCADQDNVFCVSRLAHLAAHVHLKDFKTCDFYSEGSKEGWFGTRGGNYLLGVAVGDGDAKTKQCVKILKNAGFDGYLDIEFEGPTDCVEGIARGLEFYRKELANV